MARELPQSSDVHQNFDVINLRRALLRLEQIILFPEPDSQLYRLSFERSKTATNLDYARTLLLRLEHSAASIKTQSRKQAVQTTLLQQRALLKRLNDRLYEIGQQASADFVYDGVSSGDEEGSDDEGATHRPERQPESITPPAPTSTANSPPQPLKMLDTPLDRRKGPLTPIDVFTPRTTSMTTTTSSTIRSRRPLAVGGGPTTDTRPIPVSVSGADVPGAMTDGDALFGNKRKINTTENNNPVTDPRHATNPKDSFGGDNSTAKTLESHTDLQTDLTAQLLQLASALKASAQSFASDIELDRETVRGTEAALGKSATGMEAATRRMGVLRRMSEGRWWLGRMMLYAGIFALWVVAVLLVFVGPKLRF